MVSAHSTSVVVFSMTLLRGVGRAGSDGSVPRVPAGGAHRPPGRGEGGCCESRLDRIDGGCPVARPTEVQKLRNTSLLDTIYAGAMRPDAAFFVWRVRELYSRDVIKQNGARLTLRMDAQLDVRDSYCPADRRMSVYPQCGISSIQRRLVDVLKDPPARAGSSRGWRSTWVSWSASSQPPTRPTTLMWSWIRCHRPP